MQRERGATFARSRGYQITCHTNSTDAYSIYFYFKLSEGSGMDDWLGREDLFLGTDEQRKFAVEKILEAYKVYQSLLPLQYEFMEEHKEVSPEVFEVTYSSGAVIRVDYHLETFSVLPSPAAE